MDGIAIIVMLLAILALVGVVVFFVMDYLKNKDGVDKKFNEVKGKVETEKSDRLSNLKFVVDQVNSVNQDIFTTLATSNTALQTKTDALTVSNTGMAGGLGSFLSFTGGSNAGAITLQNLPGVGNVDVKLMQHTTATMGMTANNLSAHPAQFCATTGLANDRCIQFPNADGDTYLTSMADGKSIVLGAPTVAKNGLNVNGNIVSSGTVKTNSLIANNLNSTAGSNVQFCGTGTNASRCIQFPNTDGDTLITTLDPTKKIVLVGDVMLGYQPNGVVNVGTAAQPAQFKYNDRIVTIDPATNFLKAA